LRNKPFGHNLICLYEKALTEAFKGQELLSGDEHAAVSMLNAEHQGRHLQYINVGAKSVPHFALLSSSAMKLLDVAAQKSGWRVTV
jgi:hypothetical protein